MQQHKICCLFNLLILILHRGESRTHKTTKMEILMSKMNPIHYLLSQRTSSWMVQMCYNNNSPQDKTVETLRKSNAESATIGKVN